MGPESSDDAGIYQLSEELALALTVDYITPVVDDPYLFGQIAAANALSDIYAMGARPLTVLNLIGFPRDTMPLEVMEAILQGGADKAKEAGASVIGGHSIDDKEPKYGLAVTGVVDPHHVVTNAQARVGDALILTKPLGSGIITTAAKGDAAPQGALERAIAIMSTLNRAACEAMVEVGVDACTDVTGYGLLGHLHEMCHASEVGARVSLSQVPILEAVWDLIPEGLVPGGGYRNLEAVASMMTWHKGLPEDAKLALCDPQTSGGLLIAVSQEKKERLLASLHTAGVADAVFIGEIVAGKPGQIEVIP